MRVYDTFVSDAQGEFQSKITVIPLSSVDPDIARAIKKKQEHAVAHFLALELDFEPHKSVHPKRVAAAVKSLFAYWEVPADDWGGPPDVDRERGLTSFSRKVANAEILPVERSPLAPDSLADLAGGGGAVVAWIGVLTGQPALVLIGLFGIVVVKVVDAYATGAAKAAEQLGERHFQKLLRLPDDKKNLPPASS